MRCRPGLAFPRRLGFYQRLMASLRVLRIFFVAAEPWNQFPVDMVSPPGQHELQSPPRALQRRVTLHREALSHVYARNPFRIRIYETRTGVNFFFY